MIKNKNSNITFISFVIVAFKQRQYNKHVHTFTLDMHLHVLLLLHCKLSDTAQQTCCTNKKKWLSFKRVAAFRVPTDDFDDTR